ncbi:hypothetical protein [Sphingomonas sp. EC-HK361]|uniref:hypothetical protein n=1 Tax=Sphingomonas sp. EC-HK361 TaxID=2038397 RepID=UPI0018FE5E81|nr:hypothetical protein [Sphingomonas sp. EC-HK361]
MSLPLVRAIRLVQLASLLALVAVFLRPNARWSLRGRLPVALAVFVSSAVLLLLDIL